MSEHGVGDGSAWPGWSSPEQLGQVEEPRTGGVSRLRPYVVTSGRVTPLDDTLEIEAQIVTTELGLESQLRVAFEHRDILRLCRITMSVAEMAARLRLHIGVARVLVSELAAEGYLSVHRPNPELVDDVDLIERVIRGLERIS